MQKSAHFEGFEVALTSLQKTVVLNQIQLSAVAAFQSSGAEQLTGQSHRHLCLVNRRYS